MYFPEELRTDVLRALDYKRVSYANIHLWKSPLTDEEFIAPPSDYRLYVELLETVSKSPDLIVQVSGLLSMHSFLEGYSKSPPLEYFFTLDPIFLTRMFVQAIRDLPNAN